MEQIWNHEHHTIICLDRQIIGIKIHRWPVRTHFNDIKGSYLCIEFPTIEQAELNSPFTIESYDAIGRMWKKTKVSVYEPVPYHTTGLVRVYQLSHWNEEHII